MDSDLLTIHDYATDPATLRDRYKDLKTLQESNGLLTAARAPKLPLDELREIITGGAAVPTEVEQILIADSHRPGTT